MNPLNNASSSKWAFKGSEPANNDLKIDQREHINLDNDGVLQGYKAITKLSKKCKKYGSYFQWGRLSFFKYLRESMKMKYTLHPDDNVRRVVYRMLDISVQFLKR